tara:strand:+ start:4313 stop:5026 length:714 start_codon:yes stop_codon:yes gene_type:complete
VLPQANFSFSIDLVKILERAQRLPIKSLVLLFGILVVFVMAPLAVGSGGFGLLARMLYHLVFCLGGYLLFSSKNWIVAYLVVALPAFSFGVLTETAWNRPGITVTSSALIIILQLLLIVAIIRFTLYDSSAGRLDRVIAGICGYFIIGLLWTDLYQIVNIYCPDGFRTAEGVGRLPDDGSSMYYSFVTLTTLGYGDISPANPWTRMLGSLQAVSGTLYIAVLISSLVGRDQRSQDPS